MRHRPRRSRRFAATVSALARAASVLRRVVIRMKAWSEFAYAVPMRPNGAWPVVDEATGRPADVDAPLPAGGHPAVVERSYHLSLALGLRSPGRLDLSRRSRRKRQLHSGHDPQPNVTLSSSSPWPARQSQRHIALSRPLLIDIDRRGLEAPCLPRHCSGKGRAGQGLRSGQRLDCLWTGDG